MIDFQYRKNTKMGRPTNYVEFRFKQEATQRERDEVQHKVINRYGNFVWPLSVDPSVPPITTHVIFVDDAQGAEQVKSFLLSFSSIDSSTVKTVVKKSGNSDVK